MKLKHIAALAAITFAATASSQAALTNPTVYYQFETGSTTVDTMGTLNFGTAGTTTTGKFGTAASSTSGTFGIAASTSNADGAANSSWYTEPGTTDFAASFWFKNGGAAPSGGVGYEMAVAQGARWIGGPNETAGWNLEAQGNGTIKLNFGDVGSNGTRTSITSGALSNSDWNHIAFTRVGTTMTLYLNGVATTGSAGTLDIAVNNTAGEWYRELRVGDITNATLGAGAGVDDLAFWRGTSISATDVADIYNSGTGKSIASLIPEPSAALLGGLGLLGLLRRRRI